MSTAVYYASDGFEVGKDKIMGRQVAGNSFLKAFFKYTNYDEFFVYSGTKIEADNFARMAREEGRSEEVKFIDFQNTGALSQPGILFYPGPDIYSQAQNRSFFGNNLWSLCGITHTTCTAAVIESIKALVTKPINDWDALICTSHAVRSNVINILEMEEENLRNKLNATDFHRPKLPVIPLGINYSEFQFTKNEKTNARKEFDIQDDEIVILYVGRLSFHAKSNPFPMYKSIEKVANKSNKKIVLIECGWYGNKGIEEAFSQAAKYLCKNIRIVKIDGRKNDLRLKSFAAANIFCSLSDNVQETFGITPIEAMASGLPVIVSEWNGYKETVRNKIDGFSIPTLMPRAGDGIDLAARYALGIDKYDIYIGNVSNYISVNFPCLYNAFDSLINNEKLRLEMGENGKKRALETFDWINILPQYQELWSELNSCRLKSADSSRSWSAKLDPYFAFSSYPSHVLTNNSIIKLVENSIDLTLLRLKEIKALYIVNYSKYTLPDDQVLVKIIAEILEEGISLGTLQDNLKEISSTYLVRSILWMNKFNIIHIEIK